MPLVFTASSNPVSTPGRGTGVGAYLAQSMSLLIAPSTRTALRRPALALAEEPHYDPRDVRRTVAALERAANRAPSMGLLVRSDLSGLKVADVRRALGGLPSPGDYRVVIKPLRFRKRPHLSGLCEFDVGRIIIRVPEPFRPFDEVVYVNARRKPGAAMKFAWLSEKVRFRNRRDVLRFVYLHEWLHWYLREMRGRRAGAETACDRFALRNFRRRQVSVDDALEALQGTRMQVLPEGLRFAA